MEPHLSVEPSRVGQGERSATADIPIMHVLYHGIMEIKWEMLGQVWRQLGHLFNYNSLDFMDSRQLGSENPEIWLVYRGQGYYPRFSSDDNQNVIPEDFFRDILSILLSEDQADMHYDSEGILNHRIMSDRRMSERTG